MAAAVSVVSCGTTRILSESQSRLKSNKIIIHGDSEYETSDIQPYIKQKPNSTFILGWNPFIIIYNWQNGKGRGWDKFVHKLGQAPVIFDSTLVKSTISNIGNHLTYNGNFNSVITDSVVNRRKITKVIYYIRPGKHYVIDTIIYDICDPGIERIYKEDEPAHFVKRGDFLSENILEQESSRFARVLRNKGYYGFSKNNFFFEADTMGRDGKARLYTRIRNYTRNETPKDAKQFGLFRFDSVYVVPVRNYNLFSLLPEDDSLLLDAGRLKLLDKNIRRDTLSEDGISIITSGRHNILRPKVIARINRIKPGMTYSDDVVSNTYNRFANMGLFGSVNIQLDETDSNKVKSIIKLTSSSLQGYKLNLEASSNSSGLFGVSPEISYYHKNLFKGGEMLTVSLMGNFQFKFNSSVNSNEFGVSTNLSIPNFWFINDRKFNRNLPRTEINLSYNSQERPEYERYIISAKYGYSWNVRNRLFYKINPLQISIVKIYNLDHAFYEQLTDPFLIDSYKNHFDIGMGTSFYYTTDNSARPKHSFYYLRWQNDISGNILSLFNGVLKENSSGDKKIWGAVYSQYFRTEVSSVYTWHMGSKKSSYLAFRTLAGIGIGYGNSSTLPFEKLFWAGGANSLRAWQARSIGPGYAPRDTAFTIANQTGNMRLEMNLEYRFPMFWQFEGGVFVDAGNIWRTKKSGGTNDSEAALFKFDNFYRHIAVDWGVGLRLNMGFALIRLDMGMKIYDPVSNNSYGPPQWLKRNNYTLQFGVGYPF
ncbi:MAG: BamA/TamA family outer membrane protein [Bacteroidales bacterium]|nr:BamA/TamA family outer membrane protein [Bacteroidales bacterium]